MNYYQPGKIFGIRNFVMAEPGTFKNNPRKDPKANVIFHIYYKTAAKIFEFLHANSKMEKQLGENVLFPQNSHFMICKREEDKITKQIHIYMREVKLGLADRVVLWLDDKALVSSAQI